MEKRPKLQQPPLASPALRVLRPEAAEKIQAQINEGEALLAQQPRSESELEGLREKRRI